MRRFFSVVLCSLLIFSLSACGAANNLSGYWLTSSGETINFNYNADKAYVGNFNENISEMDEYSCVVGDGVVTLVNDEAETTYTYVLEDNILTLSNENGSKSYYGDGYMQEEIAVYLHTMNGDF